MKSKKPHKKKAYIPRKISIPLLVDSRHEEAHLFEHGSLQAMIDGNGDEQHFANLADCRDILYLAACKVQDTQAMKLCSEVFYPVLIDLQTQKKQTGRFSLDDNDITTLNLLLEYAQDWWRRKSKEQLKAATLEMLKRRKALRVSEESCGMGGGGTLDSPAVYGGLRRGSVSGMTGHAGVG